MKNICVIKLYTCICISMAYGRTTIFLPTSQLTLTDQHDYLIDFFMKLLIDSQTSKLAVLKREWISYYNDIIISVMASQITSLTIVYSCVSSGAYQRRHQSSASLAFVRGIHRWPVNSPHKRPVMRKMFPFDDVIMQFHSTLYLACDYLSMFVRLAPTPNRLTYCAVVLCRWVGASSFGLLIYWLVSLLFTCYNIFKARGTYLRIL